MIDLKKLTVEVNGIRAEVVDAIPWLDDEIMIRVKAPPRKEEKR
jgi:hypothetical protein